MKRFALLLLAWLTPAGATIIPADRITTWSGNVGVPGGLPFYPDEKILDFMGESTSNTAWIGRRNYDTTQNSPTIMTLQEFSS